MDLIDERRALRDLLLAIESGAADRAERIARRPRVGRLLGAFERHGLDDAEVGLVLAALGARLAGSGGLPGMELVRRIADGAADRLAGLGLLGADGRLVARGFLAPEVISDHPAEAERTIFRLGDRVFRLACEVFGLERPPRPPAEPVAFRNNAELLAELRRLSIHYRRRAARIFHMDPWTGTGLEAHESARALVDQAREARAFFARRLEATPVSDAFAVLRLREEQGLDVDALVILATILFHELIEGVGSVDAVDLVKLVSESGTDLLRRRTMLRPLVRKELLRMEGVLAGKDLTADVSLPNDVIQRMLGEDAAIAQDEQIDFHSYLQRLESSEAFFRDLDGDLPDDA